MFSLFGVSLFGKSTLPHEEDNINQFSQKPFLDGSDLKGDLMGKSKFIVGIDVGGTFTDIVALDETGYTTITKTPSVPENPGKAVINGLRKIAKMLNIELTEFLSNVQRICHGTTVSTNALLTLTGAKVGVLTTIGFRDIVEIRTGIRENRYDYSVAMPSPLAPRHLRIGVEERIKWNGEEYIPLNKQQVRDAISLFKSQGVEAIAICFLWSFMNPKHELEAAEICKEEFPEAYLSLSSKILPEVREYRRFSTTLINSYVGPKLSSYILYLQNELKNIGYSRELLITQSSAGVMSPEVASEQAMRTVLSGPACAPAAGTYIGNLYNLKNIITVDMGGTSFDVTLIKEGEPWFTDETDVGGVYRIRLPMVDVWTVGSGGGSIAWLGMGKTLHVGPDSAGADPGPACYMKGGTEPTCTDADVVLGYLDPSYYLGGELKIDADISRKVIQEKIADPLGLNVIEAAWAIFRIVNSNMTDAISAVSVRRGEDPKKYAMVVAGGAGAIHAISLAKALGMRKLLVPRISSVFCAMGSIISDLRHDFVRTVMFRPDELDYNKINNIYKEMEDEANAILHREKIAKRDRYFRRSVDMRYIGQSHEVEVEVPNGTITPEKLDKVIELFHERHEALYAFRDTVATELINLRLASFGRVVKPTVKDYSYGGEDASNHIKRKRPVFFEEAGGFINTAIYNGDEMEYGNVVNGPAVIEQKTTTIVVHPGCTAEVGKYGDFIIDLPEKDYN